MSPVLTSIVETAVAAAVVGLVIAVLSALLVVVDAEPGVLPCPTTAVETGEVDKLSAKDAPDA